MPLRVLHVSPYFAPAFVYGGPPRSIHGLCKALGQLGVDVDVMTTTANGDGNRLPSAVNAPVVVDGVKVRYFPLASSRLFWHAPLLEGALGREVGSYDLVHVHGLWHLPAWTAAREARRSGVPYVISPRGMLEPDALAIHRARKMIAFRLGELRNLQGAAGLHATSPQEADTLTRRAFGPPIMLAPNGVDVEPVRPVALPALRAFGLQPDQRFILFLGRIHPIKRLDLLAEAAARLRARDVRLVIAGPHDPRAGASHRGEIARRFAAAGLETIWTGPVADDQKAALLTAARALVLCSDSESFGLSVAEAMAAATPVVVTQTCPWPEVEGEGAGYWVPQTSSAIANALDRILGDEHEAHAMGLRGRALVMRRYTWPASARIVLEAYEQVASRSRRHRVA